MFGIIIPVHDHKAIYSGINEDNGIDLNENSLQEKKIKMKRHSVTDLIDNKMNLDLCGNSNISNDIHVIDLENPYMISNEEIQFISEQMSKIVTFWKYQGK